MMVYLIYYLCSLHAYVLNVNHEDYTATYLVTTDLHITLVVGKTMSVNNITVYCLSAWEGTIMTAFTIKFAETDSVSPCYEDFLSSAIISFNHHYMTSHKNGQAIRRYELVDTGGYLNQLKCPLGKRKNA